MLNEEELKDAALLVFANKQDQPGAKGAGDISQALRLGELRDRNWSIMACSAVDGSGVTEGMDWLVVSSTTSLHFRALALTKTANRVSGVNGRRGAQQCSGPVSHRLPLLMPSSRAAHTNRQTIWRSDLSNGVHRAGESAP